MKFLFLLLFPVLIIGQNENLNSGKHSLESRLFETKCEKNNYVRIPNSQIKVENNRIIFDNVSTLEFDNNIDSKLKIILINGFLNPFGINKSFNLRISAIKELSLLNSNFKIKRYKFWIFSIADNNDDTILANPTEYYFELQNENAQANTTFEEFIYNAKLTCLINRGIIL